MSGLTPRTILLSSLESTSVAYPDQLMSFSVLPFRVMGIMDYYIPCSSPPFMASHEAVWSAWHFWHLGYRHRRSLISRLQVHSLLPIRRGYCRSLRSLRQSTQ